MTLREERLSDACEDLLMLIRKAQDRLTEYLHPEGSNDPDECMNDLLGLLDGPQQRAIEKEARAAVAMEVEDA